MKTEKLDAVPSGAARPIPLAADLALALASLALGFAVFGQPGIWRQAIYGTSIAGGVLLLLFRQTVEWREGILSRMKTWGLRLMALFLLLSAASVPRHTVIDAGSDHRVPYQLPGPMDHWSEGMAKEITVETSGNRGALVTLNLHESHDTLPPIIAVYGGSCHEERFDVLPGNGAVYPDWREKGKPSSYPSQVDRECFTPANNKVVFRPIAGSWVAVKNVDILELPLWSEPWRQVTEPWSWIFLWLCLALLALDWALSRPRGRRWQNAASGALTVMGFAMGMAAALAAIAAIVGAQHKWLARQEGEFRPPEIYHGSKFIRDAELGWRLLPGFTAKTLETGSSAPELFYKVNKHGFRALRSEEDFPQKGKAMVLGDSFAQGLYLAQDETVQAELARRLGGYVYNFGVAGYSSDQMYTVFQKWVDQVDAEAVVLLFSAEGVLPSDTGLGKGFSKPAYATTDGMVDFGRLEKLPDDLVEEENARALPEPELEKTYCCLARKSPDAFTRIAETYKGYLARAYYPGQLLGAIAGDIARAKAQPAPRRMDSATALLADPAIYAKNMETTFQFLVRMREESGKRGKKFLIVYAPYVLQGANPGAPEWAYFRGVFARMCATRGLPLLDPSDQLAARAGWTGAFFLDDGHFSPPGARIVGEMIADALTKKQAP